MFFGFQLTCGLMLVFYGYSVMKNPRVWGDQGRQAVKAENFPEYCRQNGLFFLKAGFIMALIGALDALVTLSGLLYVLLYLFGLAFAFYPLTRWCKENEGFSWPWPRVESEKKRIKKLRQQQEAEKAADEYKELIDKVKTALGDKVKDVRVTYRLTDSPSCLVSDEHDPSGNLARLMKAAGQPMPSTKPILEINPQHPAVMRLKYEEARFADWAALLFEQATLAEGGQLDDPAGFVRRINDLMLALSSR